MILLHSFLWNVLITYALHDLMCTYTLQNKNIFTIPLAWLITNYKK